MTETFKKIALRGLWQEIPPFRLVLGLCPVLGVTTSMENGMGMGLATMFVLVGSNALVSMLRKAIPKGVRIPCMIIIIATFVTVTEMLMQAYAYGLYQRLGIFIPLIVVNCLVLGRAQAYAYKNRVVPSMVDGAAMGVGFTLSLTTLGAVRELIGTGYLLGHNVLGKSYEPFGFVVQPPGAFICLGLLLCLINIWGKKPGLER
jgi:electron transport complex protein RnfE